MWKIARDISRNGEKDKATPEHAAERQNSADGGANLMFLFQGRR
ncbi:hypothetical protein [Pedomonas mirosovicensis]|nr:hypothetical protein [Pedomonas mirosovicensis]